VTGYRPRSVRATLPVAFALSVLAGCSSGSSTVAAAPAPTVSSAQASPSPTLSARPSPSPTRPAKATPKPVATPRATAKKTSPPAKFRFPVPVSIGNATQIVTVQSRGSYATVTAWQLSGGSWHKVISTGAARVGTHGVVPGSQRKQGTGTTPGGTYTLTQAFGIKPDPGARLPYHQLTADDWWVEDNNSAYYNQMRGASQGGFDTGAPESSLNGSEHLVTHSIPYQYVVVIDFNRWPAVRQRGAGIFLHVNGAGSTAGCVSVPLPTMVAILRWLSPAAHPRIAIA
jgi:L,D-peptidoglycan transpeptidase YkuD (ErfK/YbiS/YcfS/YnhG family)